MAPTTSALEIAADALVETQSLAKVYGKVTALNNCSLLVPRGQIFGLLGPNGSGKSTLIRLLMGFLRPTGGAATIGGYDCHGESVAVHQLVSYLPGDVRLNRSQRARDVLTFFARLRGQAGPARGVQIAERLGLDLERRVGEMSTGMRQKLALSAVLAADTPLYILDEPTTNLDPSVRSTVLAIVREARDAGSTIVFSSHVLSEIEQVCDRVVILRRGEVVHDQQMSRVRRGHRIRARLTAPLPSLPAAFAESLFVVDGSGDHVTIDALGELATVLGWFAKLPLAELRIDPIGLEAVYEQYHGNAATSANEAAA